MTNLSHHQVDLFVGAKLREFRTAHGMSQQSVASQIGVTFQQLQKYERGTNRISASKLWALAKIFRVGVSAFFEGIDTDEEPAPLLDRAGESMLRAYRRIEDPNLRRKAAGLVRALAN